MTRLRKPTFFQPSSHHPKRPGSKLTRWLIILFFFLIVSLIWLFFEYGISYLAKFTEFFSNFGREEMVEDINQDNIPPSPPQINPLPEATNSAILKMEGEAEQETEIAIFMNGQEVKRAMTDSEGNFTIPHIDLLEEENNIFATATDLAGNESQESTRQIIVLDQEPPELEIKEPQDNAKFTSEEKEITISGKTEENAIISINERKIVVDLNGEFETPYSLSDGANAVIIVAKDKAGNKVKKEMTFNYQP